MKIYFESTLGSCSNYTEPVWYRTDGTRIYDNANYTVNISNSGGTMCSNATTVRNEHIGLSPYSSCSSGKNGLYQTTKYIIKY